MEFHEKLQQLRKQRNLTQEALADILFVSRAAVSKWESGRGFPSIDSLKAIADFYCVTIDELLSNRELLTITEADSAPQKSPYLDLAFGLLDTGAALFFFLPLLRQEAGGLPQAVPLPALMECSVWLRNCYLVFLTAMILWGLVSLALRDHPESLCPQHKHRISLLLNGATVFLFIGSRQPYGAALLLLFLITKGFILVKQR